MLRYGMLFPITLFPITPPERNGYRIKSPSQMYVKSIYEYGTSVGTTEKANGTVKFVPICRFSGSAVGFASIIFLMLVLCMAAIE